MFSIRSTSVKLVLPLYCPGETDPKSISLEAYTFYVMQSLIPY